MPDYKVFNPDRDEAKNGRIGPDTPIEKLDEQTRSWLENKVREFILSNPLGGRRPRTISVFEDNVRQLLSGTIDELDGIVSVEDVLDKWAINNSFDPREFPNEVDALRDELEELKAALTEYEASEIRSENLLAERDKEIESLKERLSAYEDVAPARLSDLAEKPEFVSRLSLADFAHEKETVIMFYGEETVDTYEYSDERLHAYIEYSPTGPTGWAWELNVNGTMQMGLADSPVQAVSKVKEAYGHLTAPPPAAKRVQTTYPSPDMLESIDANTWRYDSETYGVEIKHEPDTADYVVKVSTDTGVTTKIESTYQDAYATGFKEAEKLGVNLSGVEANPGQTDTGRPVPLKEAMARGVEPPAPFPAEPSLEALSAMAPKGPVR